MMTTSCTGNPTEQLWLLDTFSEEEEDSFPFPELRVRLENKFNTTFHVSTDCLEKNFDGQEQEITTNNTGFYGCYLLRSLSEHPYGKNRTYIGFTTNPARRLRQHNGDLKAGGAWRTKSFRPWQMILVIHGFQTKTEALQFEWAWQHPTKTRALKPVNNDSKSRMETEKKKTSTRARKPPSGISGKVKTLIDLVCSPQWSSHTLTVTFLEEAVAECSELLFKTSHLPLHVQTNILPLEELGSLIDNQRSRVLLEKPLQLVSSLDKQKDDNYSDLDVYLTDSDWQSDSSGLSEENTDEARSRLEKAPENSRPFDEMQITENLHSLQLTETPEKTKIREKIYRRNVCSPDCPSCSRYCSRRRIITEENSRATRETN
ncbi:hypothetical protein GAYE_SCF07G2859 [Galdieria yellowstonensis]|uniref:Structure-specific endonuclease subunit SLX1 homolog n=1 Tax=Galdieria yellowstonensis TaxID=3028027 RepID=A0AAV9IBX4_9RHOD|nr:hypothetical protein GAYE_SCF07G2859 [Galdieria yellowstonensis]